MKHVDQLSYFQETGRKKRALMVANSNYKGKKIHKSLSITPINDIKDISGLMLKTNKYGLENIFEHIPTNVRLENILDCYVDSLNKSSEEIGTV